MPASPTRTRAVLTLLRETGWAPAAVIVGHEVGARIFGHEPIVDPVMHASGGIAIAFLVRRASTVCDSLVGAPSGLAADLLAFGLAAAAALFWEFGEQLSDVLRGTHIQTNVTTTLRDLELGVLGAAVYLLARRAIVALVALVRRGAAGARRAR
jgi:hypothetical protein